jgi:ubiquitin carboxyl-terminal hydrolase 5/13
MNSVLQLLFALPEVQNRYLEAADQIFQTSPSNVAEDFPTQMAKLACAALSNRYKRLIVNGVEDEDAKLKQIDLCPSTFRGLVGKDHPDFSTGQQQDAIEYFQYLIDYMNRSERVASNRIGALIEGSDVSLPTSSLFKFCFEDRVQCLQSNKVKYVSREDCFLQLQIPVEQATNSSQVKEYQVREEQKRQKLEQDGADHGSPQKDKDDKVVPIVPFETCIEKTLAPEVIEEFLSPATGKKGLAEKTIRFKTFPRYLLVQMRRFYVAEDWSPKKLDVSVPVPESFSLHNYQSVGLQAGEETLPETAATVVGSLSTSSSISESNVITPDETLVAQLISMGFSENGCKRAAIATSNGTAEAAMEWIFSHMEDPDFNDPLVVADENANRSPNSETYNMEHVSALMAMSFTQEQAQCALAQTSHNPDRAAEWLFSRMDDLDGVVAAWKSRQSSNAGGSSGDSSTHGLDSNCASGEYQLVGFISHIGKNTHSGHYVCHIKKNDKWIIFNDDTVAYSEEPPFSAGYLYLFRRKDKK